MSFNFTITHKSSTSRARCGLLETPNGTIQTPNFIFCATKAAIKGLSVPLLKEAGADIILSNTYHLLLQPGPDLVAAHGGLHKMMGWEGPMLTDSGGFQIFSLGQGSVADEIKGRRQPKKREASLRRITEEGATFRAYTDGRYHILTPENSIQIQQKLGADLVVVLDECTPFHVDKAYTEKSMQLSHRWAVRSLREFHRINQENQALYGIIQGGIYPDLRIQSARFIADKDFFGQAVGGSLGGSKEQMQEVVGISCANLNPNRPTHLLGIGGISDLWNGIDHGIDTFDCVHPTRIARHAGALVRPISNGGREHINLCNSRFKNDLTPLDPMSSCHYSSKYSKAYIHHLLKANESLAGIILTMHNIHFMTELAKSIRIAIEEDKVESAKKEWIG